MIEIRSLRKDDALDDLVSLSREFFEEYESHHDDFFTIDVLRDDDIVDFFSRLLDDESGEVIFQLWVVGFLGYAAARVSFAVGPPSVHYRTAIE